MDFELAPAELAIQKNVRDFAAEKLLPFARSADEQRTFDRSRVTELGRAGILGGPIRREYGGQGWTHLQWALAQIELGVVDSSWRGFCTVQTSLVGLLLQDLAPEPLRKDLLPRLASGEWIFGLALTEPLAGSDLAAMQTVARRDGEDFVLEGTKIWITNGGVADWLLVFANANPEAGRKGISCFLVPGNAKGLERKPMEGIELGHRASDHATLHFRDVRVPASSLIGALGDGLRLAGAGLEHGRLGVASGAVGIQQAALEACLNFSRERRQFGQRIGDFQLIQEVLTELHVGLEATRLLTLKAAWIRDQGRPNSKEVSVAKFAACEAAVRAADQAILLHGSRGYTSAYPVERLYRDAKGLQIYEGTAHIQRLIIGRALVGKE